ncbi:hypothetical protein DPMN_041824 [Dreissena polymorpha]|uniref:Uncharacterized protein n=1 Tax=Dreissena polymorpha TaxID=45954 RepID=A0A9D4D0X6_DREPO|nr:hypothetical protein DPMN_041824 [Dreissena polymorpha]
MSKCIRAIYECACDDPSEHLKCENISMKGVCMHVKVLERKSRSTYTRERSTLARECLREHVQDLSMHIKRSRDGLSAYVNIC